ncbi:MAG: hypothetical protein HC936_05880 [Leptolyngbyaceae cyanobacterium SU_3_3]|nr:hypothetical protein [Leptolyngbyaceae cyanobacterium SU_3_3]
MGSTNTLSVRVNDLLWHEVPALYNLKPDDQVYSVKIDDDGTTSITFGDGINGSRLPSGIDNVVATYRSGIGLSGNVAADKLSLLKIRPLGLQGVTNPLPASGAANPETRDRIRERGPSRFAPSIALFLYKTLKISPVHFLALAKPRRLLSGLPKLKPFI